ncbi:ABC-F family ATP-binding cassette domain-containing protein [Desulfuribacillus alkaliarsenatis]|uniref:ABC transporter domain-containing protein n=1 Tax=Desulfuribacillus alkaliarsenatis TaxID=766136 RepID=A0A1E5G243_9FIRM|nr:ABC-F family ATP-binding cassette domain-containing protein [Desulfuribacillus alkaliarsenatis]OEF96967.1 hypothetical protein BHF68_05010 [Desulfuribacillus alkaliarsenatis]
MIILQTINISKSYGVTPILTKVCLQVQAKDKIGVVGPNGAGKSTLLKIIAGKLPADSGEVQITKGKVLCYLAQDSGLDSRLTIWDEMLSVFATLHEQEQRLRQLEIEMGKCTDDPEALESIMAEYSELQEAFERSGGHKLEADIRNVLAGLGFSDINYKEMTINQCSGGQKTRLALAKILLSQPDIILLDEPTNYLDIDALTWLEQFIKDFPGALMVVSHDRYFLDSFINVVYEIDNNKGTAYPGTYHYYLSTKEQRLLEQEQLYLKQHEEIAKTQEFIQKNIARASTSARAKSRRKQLENMELLDSPTKQNETFFSFRAKKRTGNIVLDIKNLGITFDSSAGYLFVGLNLQIERGERIAIIGPNGTGKSTLLKLIAEQLKPTAGEITHGSNVQIGYYDQEQADLTKTNTVFEEVHDDFPHMTRTEIRSALAQFLFVGEDVDKHISSLSGGEKARVTLTKLMLAQDNLLLLDEPTNHLDIPAKEALEQALLSYDGTMIFISHDRYFLNQIATRVIYMTRDKLKSYLGNYDYYLEKNHQEKQQLEETKQKTAQQKETHEELKRRRNLERQLQKQYDSFEADIQTTEVEIEDLEKQLCNPEIFDNHVEVAKLQEELSNKQFELDTLMEKWEQAALELEKQRTYL